MTDDARVLLRDAICPHCANAGYVEGAPKAVCCNRPSANGECCGSPLPEQTQEQCQWCAMRAAHLAAPAPEPRVAENLAMMLRRLIYQINKLDGDSSLKVLSGKASDLLSLYGLQGSPLRELPPLPKEEK